MMTHVVEQPHPISGPSAPRRTILIVEDDADLARALALRLTDQDFEVLIASRGDEGLSTARRQRPDLILLDLRLPDIDGLELCRELTDSPDTCLIPVIVISGQQRHDIIRRCRTAGCQYFVGKPYDPNALLVLIRQALDEANTWELV